MNKQNIKRPIVVKLAVIAGSVASTVFLIFAVRRYLQNENIKEFLILLGFITYMVVVIAWLYIATGKGLKSKTYHMDLSPKELFILIFYKKVCPKCDSKLKKIKKTNFTGEGTSIVNNMFVYGSNYNIKYYYECEKCNRIYNLSELANKK